MTALIVGCSAEQPTPSPSPSPTPTPDPPKVEKSVIGQITAEGKPMSGVVVSDGYLTDTTDLSGNYYLKSAKMHEYVFISIPDGYDVSSTGVIPNFYGKVGLHTQDTIDFKLTPITKKGCRIFVLGDMHLANKRRDISQFQYFVKDLNDQRSNGDFAITVGDMSWDAYWGGYDLNDYLAEVNKDFSGMQIFHTIGNHDHDLSYNGDWNTVIEYKKILGPTYYSFNREGIHFIVLDDIVCTNKSGQRSSYNKVTQEQLDWLKDDLKYVSKDTPLALFLHCPIYKDTGNYYLSSASELIDLLQGYPITYCFSGHTHTCYNTDKTKATIPHFESTCGAVCGAWWYTVYDYPKENVHISSDGAPGGYKILEARDGNIKWQFKGTGQASGYQFRTYDRNEICIDEAYVPNATKENKDGFVKLAEGWNTKSTSNYVYINVWDYDPQWKVEVTENGNSLYVTQVTDLHDPLYLISSEAYSFDHGYTTEYTKGVISSYYPGYEVPHIFRVKANSATSTLNIKVTDRFGKTYTETMIRPKALKIEY